MRLLAERGHCCERCKANTPRLSLHHKTYDRLGRERDSDLELLCEACHEQADAERAAFGRAKAENALYDARLEGWASRRYGEDWAERQDPDAIAEEFDEWLDRHESINT